MIEVLLATKFWSGFDVKILSDNFTFVSTEIRPHFIRQFQLSDEIQPDFFPISTLKSGRKVVDLCYVFFYLISTSIYGRNFVGHFQIFFYHNWTRNRCRNFVRQFHIFSTKIPPDFDVDFWSKCQQIDDEIWSILSLAGMFALFQISDWNEFNNRRVI